MRTARMGRWGRGLAGLALAALMVAPVATPVAAADRGASTAGTGRTWVVDDDGRATPVSCSASATAPRKIQKAIDLAGPGDTILVCPGLYREQPVVSGTQKAGLTIRGVIPWEAVLKPTDVSIDVAAFRIASTNDVTVQWLRFLSADVAPACINVSYALLVQDGRDITIRGNRFAPGVADPVGPCRFQNGIAAEGRTRVRILYNWMRDSTGTFVYANGPSVSLRIARNSFRTTYDGDGSAMVVANEGRATIVANHFLGVPNRTSIAISVVGAKEAQIRDNWLRRLAMGIAAFSATDPRVLRNRIEDASVGIFTSETTGSIVRGNRITADGSDLACASASDTGALWVDNLRTGGASSPEEICPLAP